MFRLGVLLLFPLLAVAQLTPNSVTVTASRTIEVQADQFYFNITIYARPDVGLDDVLAVARGAGLTMANFLGVHYQGDSSSGSTDPGTTGTTGYPQAGGVSWDFGFGTPIAQMKSILGLLTAFQTNLAKEGKYSLGFYMSGLTTSTQAQQAQSCPLADVIAGARPSAVKLASAAGLTVGAIQAMSSPRYYSSAGSGGIGNCAVTVRFSLGGI
jgi:hypothetical protein